MTSSLHTVPATPFAYAFPAASTALVVIDMQRDFIEPGGFGASLGNDVTRLHPSIGPITALLALWRARGWPVIHTREAHRAEAPPDRLVDELIELALSRKASDNITAVVVRQVGAVPVRERPAAPVRVSAPTLGDRLRLSLIPFLLGLALGLALSGLFIP